jgi:NAD(P)-dependent dehydrogenase (short-subunit alcohol dehydrogenase family)
MAIALVTGTSTGIGLATAITLGRSGHTVYAGMRNLARAGDLQAVVAKEQLPVSIVQLDVDDDGSVNSAIQQVLAARGHIDVLVNNAGIGGGGPVEEVPIDVFRRIMETNFFGGLRCIKAAIPGMRGGEAAASSTSPRSLAVLGHRRRGRMQPRSGLLRV